MSHAAGPADLLREAERRRLQSLVEGDIEIAGAMHADDYQLITPGGASLSKEDYVGGVASGRRRAGQPETARRQSRLVTVQGDRRSVAAGSMTDSADERAVMFGACVRASVRDRPERRPRSVRTHTYDAQV